MKKTFFTSEISGFSFLFLLLSLNLSSRVLIKTATEPDVTACIMGIISARFSSCTHYPRQTHRLNAKQLKKIEKKSERTNSEWQLNYPYIKPMNVLRHLNRMLCHLQQSSANVKRAFWKSLVQLWRLPILLKCDMRSAAFRLIAFCERGFDRLAFSPFHFQNPTRDSCKSIRA